MSCVPVPVEKEDDCVSYNTINLIQRLIGMGISIICRDVGILKIKMITYGHISAPRDWAVENETPDFISKKNLKAKKSSSMWYK